MEIIDCEVLKNYKNKETVYFMLYVGLYEGGFTKNCIVSVIILASVPAVKLLN